MALRNTIAADQQTFPNVKNGNRFKCQRISVRSIQLHARVVCTTIKYDFDRLNVQQSFFNLIYIYYKSSFCVTTKYLNLVFNLRLE